MEEKINRGGDLKIGSRGQILYLRHSFTTNYHPYERSPVGRQISKGTGGREHFKMLTNNVGT